MKAWTRRSLSAALAAALCLGLSGGALGAGTTGDTGAWYDQAVTWAAQRGLLQDEDDGAFDPNQTITRQGYSALLEQALGLSAGTVDRPADAIQREEGAILLATALGMKGVEGRTFTDGAQISAQAMPAVQALVAAGLLSGYPDGSFGPQRTMTWAEACQELYGARDRVAAAQGFHALELGHVPVPTHDPSDANQLPLTGYFRAELTGEQTGREVRYYIPDTAVIRPYYHFIAVPDGVDVDQFLLDTGWKQIADETGECLYLLIPNQTTKTWGTGQSELAYMDAAKALHSSNGKYFTTFGEFYLVGYGAGVAPLEGWAAQNPHLVIAQAYLNGASYGLDALQQAGAGVYGYTHITDGDNKDRDADGVNERRDANGAWKVLHQMTAPLKNVLHPEDGTDAGLLKKSDMPVPTWLVNAPNGEALTYWKQVGRATGAAADQVLTNLGGVAVTGKVYDQKEDTWPTEYAGPISKVVELAADATENYAFSRALRDEMTDYTRYDNTISYGNGLMYRLDYSEILVERFTNAEKKSSGTVSGLTLEGKQVRAELSMQRITLNNGINSDLIVYVPETAPAKDIPVVVVFHGGSQTSTLFMDATCWWQTAAAEGFALAFSTRTAHIGTSYDTTLDLPVFDKTVELLTADGRFNMGRIYVTGQSMGSVATIALAEERTDQIAGVISSNAGGPSKRSGGDAIPAGLVVGEGNYANRGIPGYAADTSYPEDATTGLVRSTAAAAAGADIYWDAPTNSKGEEMHDLNDWVSYFAEAAGLGSDSLRKEIVYSGATSLNGGKNDENGTLNQWSTNGARMRTWVWEDGNGSPILTYIYNLYQAHNCQPNYRPAMWDFLEHYSIERNADGSITRYYSPSAFAQDDAVVILD